MGLASSSKEQEKLCRSESGGESPGSSDGGLLREASEGNPWRSRYGREEKEGPGCKAVVTVNLGAGRRQNATKTRGKRLKLAMREVSLLRGRGRSFGMPG